jgi:hypothetical protein
MPHVSTAMRCGSTNHWPRMLRHNGYLSVNMTRRVTPETVDEVRYARKRKVRKRSESGEWR